MTQQERDMMVERYTDGTMSQSERHEFLDLLDSDEGLRQALYAETLINKAVRSDRTAMPMPTAASRARFLTMLATVAPENAAPVAGSGSEGGSGIAGKGATAARGVAGSGATKIIVSTLAGLAVTIGAILVVPKLIESPAPKTEPPAVVSQPGESQPAPRQMTAPPATEVTPQVTTGQASPSVTVEPRPGTVTPAARKRTAVNEIERREGAKSAKRENGRSEEGVKKEDPKVLNGKTPAQINIQPPIINE